MMNKTVEPAPVTPGGEGGPATSIKASKTNAKLKSPIVKEKGNLAGTGRVTARKAKMKGVKGKGM